MTVDFLGIYFWAVYLVDFIPLFIEGKNRSMFINRLLLVDRKMRKGHLKVINWGKGKVFLLQSGSREMRLVCERTQDTGGSDKTLSRHELY